MSVAPGNPYQQTPSALATACLGSSATWPFKLSTKRANRPLTTGSNDYLTYYNTCIYPLILLKENIYVRVPGRLFHGRYFLSQSAKYNAYSRIFSFRGKADLQGTLTFFWSITRPVYPQFFVIVLWVFWFNVLMRFFTSMAKERGGLSTLDSCAGCFLVFLFV